MSRMTEADRLRRAEERLQYEGEQVKKALDRLDGIKDPRVISIRNSYILTQSKITEYIFSIHRELDHVGMG